MDRAGSVLVLLVLGFHVAAQEPMTGPAPAGNPASAPGEIGCAPQLAMTGDDTGGSRLSGNHAFPNFIGFITSPEQNIDPRAVTELYPVFGNEWTTEAGPVPQASSQVYAAGLTIALSDRLAVGLNQGGYEDLHLSMEDAHLLTVLSILGRQRVLDLLHQDPLAVLALLRQHGLDIRDLLRLERLLRVDPTGKFADVEAGGSRTGFLNLGGFVQYTLIEDVASQFLLTAGLRLGIPCGSYEVFQGHGPVELAPYVTIGKGFGLYHVLATTGFDFPIGPGSDNLQVFYADLHVDRQTFGWLYPLMELNLDYGMKGISPDLSARSGFFNLGNFEASGNILNLALGANAVLIPEKLELGAAYMRSIATERDFGLNQLIVKMVYRF